MAVVREIKFPVGFVNPNVHAVKPDACKSEQWFEAESSITVPSDTGGVCLFVMDRRPEFTYRSSRL